MKQSSKMLAVYLLVHDLASLGDVSLVVRADQPVHCKSKSI
jgi:hypothetical protein